MEVAVFIVVLWAASIWLSGALWGFTAAAAVRPVQRVGQPTDEEQAVAEAEAVLRGVAHA